MNGECKVSKYYPGLSLAGKGYSIVQKSNLKHRYYTICNSMGSANYPLYKELLKSLNSNSKPNYEINSIADLKTKTDNNVELIVKYYS